jgi:hypothetical protein
MTIPAMTAVGFPILRAHATRAVPGMLAGAIVLCDISAENPDDPFAVWWMNEVGETFDGGYCSTRREADESFERRLEHERKMNRAD